MGSIYHSKNHALLAGEESTFGTAVATTKDLGLIQGFTPADKRTVQKNYGSGSREVQDVTVGKHESGFDVELELQHGRVFEYILGSVSHANTSADWKHTFDFAETIPSATIQSGFNAASDAVFLYSGSKVNEGTISCEADGKLTAKTLWIAQDVDTSTAAASGAVISALKPLHFKNLSLSTGVAASETSVGKVQKFDLTFSNDLKPIDAAGTVVAQELTEGNIDMTYTFDMTFEDTVEYNRFLGGTSVQTEPTAFSTIFNAHNGVTLGSGRREFYCQLDNCIYEEVGTPVQIGEVVVQSFTGTAKDFGTNKLYYVDNISDTAF